MAGLLGKINYVFEIGRHEMIGMVVLFPTQPLLVIWCEYRAGRYAGTSLDKSKKVQGAESKQLLTCAGQTHNTVTQCQPF